jgi:hypothetical protein
LDCSGDLFSAPLSTYAMLRRAGKFRPGTMAACNAEVKNNPDYQ